MPIPSVSCKTFWQIGNNKVPFGVAIALDVYKNGAFKKIQKVQRTDGIEAACRLYEQFYRELSNDDILSDIKGAEILVGRHISSFSYRDSSAYYWTLIIDGYPHRRGNSFGAVKADGWKDIAEDFSSAMRECGIRGYKLVNGIRLENKKRITESKLTPSELYWLTTIMNENDCFSTE